MAFNYHTIASISATFRHLCHWRMPPASVATSLRGLLLPTPSCCRPWLRCLLLLLPPLSPPANPGSAHYRRPQQKRGSDTIIRDCKWTMPSPMSADALIVANATKGTMLCSLALDYSIHIRLLGENDKLRWELLPLSRWEGPNLGVGAIALHALSNNGAKEEGGFMLRTAAL